MRRLAAGIALVALAGCGSSPPAHFFTLDATAPQTRVEATSDAPIQVASVHIPSALDRLSMVRGEQDHQLTISDQDRWGAPFDDLTRRVLTQDLSRRLSPGMVLPPDAKLSGNARGVVVDILTFQPDASGQVTLDADWTLLQGDPAKPVLRRSVRLTDQGGGTAADQAAALSRLVGQLAHQIISGISSSQG
jgi:uncharacterized lipoprotein YmbA